jgi:transcription initiation factor TFIID subunit 10
MADQNDIKPAASPPSQVSATQQDSAALDTSIDSTVNGDKAANSQGPEATSSDVTMQNDEAPATNGITEERIPTKKDATLREFLSKMDEHAPIVRCNESRPRCHPDI